eukprot:scaffold36685_cov294-Skeletonema_dohrnii-CCMP3373.AAC.1
MPTVFCRLDLKYPANENSSRPRKPENSSHCGQSNLPPIVRKSRRYWAIQQPKATWEMLYCAIGFEPFMGGRSIASGILYAELDDIIAGRMTEMGLHVLQTICDAFADAELVDVNLSDNAIGQQGIGACKT